MDAYLKKSFVMQAIFNALTEHPYGLNGQQLITYVYRNCNEPSWAYNCISVTVRRFNKRMEKLKCSLRVRGRKGRNGGYQIWIVR